MAVQVEDLVQAVAEGVLRAAEARNGAPQGGAGPAAASRAASSRTDLISQLTFEVRIRAGGIPAGPIETVQAE